MYIPSYMHCGSDRLGIGIGTDMPSNTHKI